MNKMEQYDKALMEGVVSQSRLEKKRMKAFMEAVSEIAPRELVEAVVTAHNALFEFGPSGFVHYGMTPNGVRTKTQTGNYSTKRTYNGNDLVRTNDRYKPPTSANTDWHLQNGQGSAAYRQYNNVIVNDPMPRIDPREYERPSVVNMHNEDHWENERMSHQAPPPPPPQMEPPRAVRQPEPPKVEPPKVECPPVCPEPPKVVEKPVENKPTEEKPATEKKAAPAKKAAAPYKWNDNDFHPADDPKYKGKCSTTHRYVINLVSFNKDNDGAAAKEARFLSSKGVAGVYTYQFDGLAQNTTRPDVWRVRIGYFKSKAAARTYFRKHIHNLVGDQFKWWVGTCDGDKGDKMKPGTLKYGNEISDSDCVDGSAAKKSVEQPTANTPSQPTANTTAQQGTGKEKEHKTMEGLLSEK